MPTGQHYSSVATQAQLTSGISNVDVTCTVNTTSGFPAQPFTIVFDIGAPTQEIADVTNVSGTTLTITRGVDGSAAQSHSPGATVTHSAIARDLRESRAHIDASTSNDSTGHSVHGLQVGSSVVGTTDTQTISGKTLTNPVINGGSWASPTFTNPSISGNVSGSATYSNITLTGTVNAAGATITTPTLTLTTIASQAAGNVPLQINGVNGQTGDLTEWNVNSVLKSKVDGNGLATFPAVGTSGLTGAATAGRWVGTTASGPPTTGTFLLGDWVIDNTWNTIWLCTTAGSPGTWEPLGPVTVGETVLSSTASSVTFSGIPAAHRIVVYWRAKCSTANQSINFQVDGNAGSVYLWGKLSGRGNVANSTSSGALTTSGEMGVAPFGTASYFGNGVSTFDGWSNSTGFMTMSGTSTAFDSTAGYWSETYSSQFNVVGPHTSLTIFPGGSDTFAAGSQFLLLAYF